MHNLDDWNSGDFFVNGRHELDDSVFITHIQTEAYEEVCEVVKVRTAIGEWIQEGLSLCQDIIPLTHQKKKSLCVYPMSTVTVNSEK